MEKGNSNEEVTRRSFRIAETKQKQQVDPLKHETSVGKTKKANNQKRADKRRSKKHIQKTPGGETPEDKESDTAATLTSNHIFYLYYVEDLDAEVNKLCKAVRDHINNYYKNTSTVFCVRERKWHRINKHPVAQLNGFVKFSQHFESTFNKFMESYSRAGDYADSLRDVEPPPGNSAEIPLFSEGSNSSDGYSDISKFAMGLDSSDHLFKDSVKPTYCSLTTRVYEELKTDLHDGIFVRASAERVDLLRAVVIGPKGTPYCDGLFFFDILLPNSYPTDPPAVRYHSCGFAINPHLFKCGEVRLNLFSDLYQPASSLWKETTNMAEFLNSIKKSVLSADPFLLQPVSSEFEPSVVTDCFSLLYNQHILIKSLKIMTNIIKKPPKGFEDFVVGHFHSRVSDILKACRDYKDMGCSVEVKTNIDSSVSEFLSCLQRKVGQINSDVIQENYGELPADMQASSSGSTGL